MMNVEVRSFQNALVSEEEDRASDGSGNEGTGGEVQIRKPGEHDVLLGRGGGTNNHSGNVKFRRLVKEHKMRYLACSKVEKPKVAREVVELWRKLDPPGRFLTRQESPMNKTGPGSVKDANNVWVEVSDKKAREKASQCLRERTEDVIPYLSQLRKQQDEMTEQGVTQVQRKLQMENENDNNKSEVYTSPSMAKESPKKSVLSNMPDRAPSSTIAPSPDRRMSLPVVSSGAVPVSPAVANAGHGGVSRRTSLPPVNQMQAQQMKMNMQIMAHQQEMMHKQQVLKDAYTAIERSNGMQMMQQNMMSMQQAMGQQHMLAERQAMMQQQYANFGDGGPMSSPMATTGGMTPQEQRMMMMQQQQHNNMMAQQQAMARTGGMHRGMMNHHQQEMNMAMMANNNNNNNMNQMTNINAGMHNMHMNNNMNMMSNHVQQQMPSPLQQREQRMVGHIGGMPNMNPPLMNDQQSPRLMHGGQNHRNQANSNFGGGGGGGSPNNMNGNMGVHHPQQNPRRDVDAPLDFEPLPAYETANGNDQGPGGRQGYGALPDDAKSSSAPPRFISPNIVDENDEKKQGEESEVDSKLQQEDRQQKDVSKSAASSSSIPSSSSLKPDGEPAPAAAAAAARGGDDSSTLPVGHKIGDDKDDDDVKGPSLSPPGDEHKGNGHETALKEYRKTLESYIENHQISTPAVDIDDDASDDDEDGANGPGFEGIDASEWIQQALNDSADMSLNDRSKHLANARRALLKDSRDNSKKSLMSTGTGMTGFTGGHDSMSIALSDMEECSLPLKDHAARDAPTRGSFSNRSISSELTDFSELDGL